MTIVGQAGILSQIPLDIMRIINDICCYQHRCLQISDQLCLSAAAGEKCADINSLDLGDLADACPIRRISGLIRAGAKGKDKPQNQEHTDKHFLHASFLLLLRINFCPPFVKSFFAVGNFPVLDRYVFLGMNIG